METVHTDPCSAAKAIRLELKSRFPGIKFRVRTKKYSGGNSIWVNWVLGPTEAAVRTIIDKYQYGNFDGMTDSYSHDATLMSCPNGEIKELGGAKYVFAVRDYAEDWKDAEAFRERVARDLCALEGLVFKDMNMNITGSEKWNNHSSLGNVVGRILSRTDLTKGYKGMKRTATTCGAWEEFYEVIPTV